MVAPGALTIIPAIKPEDVEAVRVLCQSFLDWVQKRYAAEPWLIDVHYGPEEWARVMDTLEEIHRPPEGAILLARIGEKPAGCIMMQTVEPGLCEMKRLFVSSDVRRSGIALALCRALMVLARDRGYMRMRLETGTLQSEAIALYQSLGFVRTPPFRSYPAETLERMVFMERRLDRPYPGER